MSQDIKIPIKSILEICCKLNNSSFDEYDFILLRKFFIALLNLNVLSPNNLPDIVERFTKQIHSINVIEATSCEDLITKEFDVKLWKMKNYIIIEKCIYINEALLVNDENYEITLYKAVSEVVLQIPHYNMLFSNLLSNILGEHVYHIDNYSSKVIPQKTHIETINGKQIKTRTGYTGFELPTILFEQFLCVYEINIFDVLKTAIEKDISMVYRKLFRDRDGMRFTSRIFNAFDRYCERVVSGRLCETELNDIQILQIDMAKKFRHNSIWFKRFCSLSTIEELRKISEEPF